MPKFRVYYWMTKSASIEVEAPDKEAAMAEADARLPNLDGFEVDSDSDAAIMFNYVALQ